MHTFARLKSGEIRVVWSDNTQEETMNLISLSDCDEHGNYDIEWFVAKEYPYSEIEETDTNLAVLKKFA